MFRKACFASNCGKASGMDYRDGGWWRKIFAAHLPVLYSDIVIDAAGVGGVEPVSLLEGAVRRVAWGSIRTLLPFLHLYSQFIQGWSRPSSLCLLLCSVEPSERIAFGKEETCCHPRN